MRIDRFNEKFLGKTILPHFDRESIDDFMMSKEYDRLYHDFRKISVDIYENFLSYYRQHYGNIEIVDYEDLFEELMKEMIENLEDFGIE